MVILLITWVCGSTVLCLAVLGVAARRVPRTDEPMTARGEGVQRQPTAVAMREVEAPAYAPILPAWRSAQTHGDTCRETRALAGLVLAD